MSDTRVGRDRRTALRIQGEFPLHLRSREVSGSLDIVSIADNVSRWGLHARLLRRFDVGRGLFGLVSLPTGAVIAARCRVMRLEPLAGGGWGTAVRFTSARLLLPTSDEIWG